MYHDDADDDDLTPEEDAALTILLSPSVPEQSE
jgi:hypothetical protein